MHPRNCFFCRCYISRDESHRMKEEMQGNHFGIGKVNSASSSFFGLTSLACNLYFPNQDSRNDEESTVYD